MPLPPLPSGYQLQGPPPRNPDLLSPLFSLGVQATNGYRTRGDIQRLKAQGYQPAPNSRHLDGDAVDLTPGKSGLSLSQLKARADAIAGNWKGGRALNEGDHVHLQLPGWGMAPGTPGTPNFGLPPLPAGASLQQRGALHGSNLATPPAALNASTALTPVALTGKAHDADTFGLANGRNGRLFGADAFELGQKGRLPNGQLVPLGPQARDFMLSQIAPGMSAVPTGDSTYGRPVVTLSENPMNDPAQRLLRSGLGAAEPQFLKGSPQFGPYMEAERLARLNQLGGFQTNAETPSQFRHKNGPWLGAEPGVYGQPGSEAIFFDEKTPFGLRPDIAKGYQAIAADPKSVGADLVAYGKANGFVVDPTTADKFIKARNANGGKFDPTIHTLPAPRPEIDPGDKAFGSFARGLGDPFNALDELGAIPDSLGLTRGRMNVFNAPAGTRFGDIYGLNVDQNRAILEHDADQHPVARIAGQLTSGVALPMGAASTPLRLGAMMGAEGGLSGLMAGEGGITQRIPNAAIGTVLGSAGGLALGAAGQHLVAPLLRRLTGKGDQLAGDVVSEAMPVVNDGLQNAGPTPAARTQPQGGVTAAMAAERGPELVGPVVGRPRDVINVHDLPPLPDGFNLEQPFGVTRPVGERLSADEMAKLAEGVDPRGAIPRPGNQVESLDEALKANPGRFVDLLAPNETDALPRLPLKSGSDLFKTGVRRDVYDVTKMIRKLGGVNDDGGDLAHLGITNAPRSNLPFGRNEQFLGKLVNNDTSRSLDEIGEKLWEMGYFKERPTTAELIDVLHDEHLGNSHYHPEDLEAVDEFHRLQDQRRAIEQARDEGSPLADDRSSEINLDDLIANSPPANAYEDMPRVTGRIGNVNLDHIENPQQINGLIEQIANRVGGFDAAARGKVTNEETRRLAQEMGVKPEQILQRRQGQALNAEQLYAMRATVQGSRERVVRLAKKAVGGSDEDLMAFRKAWLFHAALEEQLSGATAEAGRALQQFKMLARGKDATGEAIRNYLRGGKGRSNIEDAAQAIVDLSEDPAKANHFIRESVKPNWHDKLNELWINSLLSGPRTHVVNFVGNALTAALTVPEQALTAGIGAVTRSADRSTIGEVGARLRGMVDGAIEGLGAARQAFRTGDALDQTAKVENAHFHAIGGRTGQIVRLPTRALTAADEFWKSINRNAELHALAYRQATTESRDPAAWNAAYEHLLRSPTDAMQKQAGDAARYYTFQKELGPAGRAVSQLSNSMPGGKILIPFVRTPINLLKFAGERSALAPLMPSVRQALKAGGRSRDEALARITLGSGLSTAAVVGALGGRISGGGPSDPRERAALLQSGWQPYSIRIGDQWVSYARFDPVSTLLGVAADFAEAGKFATKKEADEVALNLAMGIAKNVTNKTWLSGLSDAFDVLSDPERYGKGYVRKLAAAMAVPAIASQTAQAMDPNLRDARTIMDAIKARVPVLSESVPVRRNVWGDPIDKGDAIGPDILSPFYASKASASPLSQEIARLRVPLTMPQRHLMIDGKRVDLNPQQYDELTQLSGKPARQYLEQAIRSPDWRTMHDGERVQFVRDSLADFREAGREALLERHPELGAALVGAAPPAMAGAIP